MPIQNDAAIDDLIGCWDEYFSEPDYPLDPDYRSGTDTSEDGIEGWNRAIRKMARADARREAHELEEFLLEDSATPVTDKSDAAVTDESDLTVSDEDSIECFMRDPEVQEELEFQAEISQKSKFPKDKFSRCRFSQDDINAFFLPRSQASTQACETKGAAYGFPTGKFNADKSSPNEIYSTQVQALEPQGGEDLPEAERPLKKQKTLHFMLAREATFSNDSAKDASAVAVRPHVDVASNDKGAVLRSTASVGVAGLSRLSQRGFADKLFRHELGIMGHSGGSRRAQAPIADWRFGTANFCSTARDVHATVRLAATVGGPALSMPFCVTACNKASVVLVGDDDGIIRCLNTSYPPYLAGGSGFDNVFSHFKIHGNAILDCQLSRDDLLLATASGDQSARITDMLTQKPVRLLDQHTQTLKQVQFQPGTGNGNVLATCGRDGTIRIWDLRDDSPKSAIEIPGERQRHYKLPELGTNGNVVNTIDRAHGKFLKSWLTPEGRAKYHGHVNGVEWLLETPRSPKPISITAIQFLPAGREHLLASVSENDSSIRLWDIRKTPTAKTPRPAPVSYTRQPNTHYKWRPYGISSMCLNTDGSRLFAASRDSTVYAYSTAHLISGRALEENPANDTHLFNRPGDGGAFTKEAIGPIYGFRHKEFKNGSFYPRIAVRAAQDGQSELLAVGTSTGHPVLFPTDERVVYAADRLDDAEKAKPFKLGKRLRAPTPPEGSREWHCDDPNAYRSDAIPISSAGTALMGAHAKEVGGVAFSRTGKLVTMSDDKTVRCWSETRWQAADLRAAGVADQGRRWGCGWADVEEDFDEVDDEW